MFCVECGKEIPDGVKFCHDCGASQIDKGRKKVGLKKLKRSREMPLETESEEETVKAKPKEKRPIEKKELEPYEVEVLNELTEKRKYYAKILLFALIYITKTNPTPPTPVIHEHKRVQNVIQPTKRVLVEREVCKDVRGCELLKCGNCPDCVIESFWE